MDRTTVTLQIGNTDNKLTQQQWAEFVQEVNHLLDKAHKTEIHFHGAPPTTSIWQNAAWVFVTAYPRELADEISRIRMEYLQDSVAWTEGTTEFI